VALVPLERLPLALLPAPADDAHAAPISEPNCMPTGAMHGTAHAASTITTTRGISSKQGALSPEVCKKYA
tara:strand:+ start:342 stop:551 length:210 start_codon:yes stop_codon:yes gene_type:complete